ncbi:PKD domain-containing protein [Natrinema halophilum]|uniref:PKD domain-containing protein n=1 Tax=Natrinema halophilum TaxID=1699371 RepID=A0A7D5GLL4_9EURY|nr:PKD domain-containing protein [Natrinema halophilum]QLG50010.1 PKD domain-containing protein [Natrinema halophilum]
MSAISVYVYPNTRSEDDLARIAKNAVEAGLEGITSDSRIGGYDVEIRNRYPNQRAGSLRGFFDAFRTWRERNGFTGTGCHLGIGSGFGGGLADNGQYSNAFNGDANCVVGGRSGGGSFFKNAAIQETLHTLIDPGLPQVSQMIGQNDEHTLGMIYQDRSVSPMVTGYVRRGLGNSGTCRNNLNAGQRTTNTSPCSADAVEYTWIDRTGGRDGGDGGGNDRGGNDEGGDGTRGPSVDVRVSATEVDVGETIQFDGRRSSDPDGSIQSYEWSFGDGSTATGGTVQHAYESPGDFQASLTVTDDDGFTDTGSFSITVQGSRTAGNCGDVSTGGEVTGRLAGWWDGNKYQYASALANPCEVTITMEGPGDADFDLYVTTDGRTPRSNNYDEKSDDPNSRESVTVSNVTPGQQFGILVDSYSGAGSFRLSVTERGT